MLELSADCNIIGMLDAISISAEQPAGSFLLGLTVEESHWIAATHASLPRRFDGNLDTEALEVDDRSEDE
jgi:hypothetical protein